MPVSLDPDKQLDLSARKYLAARLLRLTRTAHLQDELDNQTCSISGKNAHSNDGSATAILLDGLSSLLDTVILQCLEDEQSAINTKSLIHFLDSVQIGFEKSCAHFELTCKAFKRVDINTQQDSPEEDERDIDLFNCTNCGRAGWSCNGGLIDRHMIADPEGGLCLSFLKQIVENFASVAEGSYAEIVGETAAECSIPTIVLETYRNNSSTGTLPIDGEFQQPTSKAPAIMRIHWPVDGELDSAIKSLPYLVFHEVFVHGLQGAGLECPRFRVSDDCAFTEGAVDAVACDILLDRVLPMENALPKLLKPLYSELEQACREYHQLRFKKEERSKTALLDPANNIRGARYRGRSAIYNPLKQMREQARRDSSWLQRVILSLNLHLDKDQRREVFKLFNRLTSVKSLRMAMIGKLDVFLSTTDTEKLLSELHGLLHNDANAP